MDAVASAAKPEHATVSNALVRFLDEGGYGWADLPFFANGEAQRVAAVVDAEIATGVEIAPRAENTFRALRMTPLDRVKAVILGQDPYPRRGDANGLAFSFHGTKSSPPSLRTILKELADDIGCVSPDGGDLTAWASEGVLLLNSALTTRVGESGVHLRLGWSDLTDQAIRAVSRHQPAVAFLLWGGPARRRAVLVDRTRHLVLESGHPSPLNRARDFAGSRPFSRANDFLRSRGVPPIDWRLA